MKQRAVILLGGGIALLTAGCSSTQPAPAVPPSAVVRPVPAEVQAPVGLSDHDFAAWMTGQRSRVSQSRTVVQQQFTDAELACWQRFAVNDCVRAARAERRTALSRLRDEELALNLQQRQRDTAGRLKQLSEKQPGVEQGK